MTRSIYKLFKVFFIIAFFFLCNSIVVSLLKYFKIDYYLLNGNLQKLVLLISQIICLLVLFLIYRKDLIKEFKTYTKNIKSNLLFSLKWWIIGLVLMNTSSFIISFITNYYSSNEELLITEIKNYPFYMLISACILVPFIEEIVFRKSIKEVFPNKYLYIIASAFIFGGIHVLSSTDIIQCLYIIPYGIFGAIFAYMYEKTDTIFTSIFIHLIHNLCLTLLYITIFIGG